MKKKKIEKRYELIDEDSIYGQELFPMLRRLVSEHHTELIQASILPAWMIGNKQDRDGILVLGRMKKATELERQAHGADAFLLLNAETWPLFDERQKNALVDHELEHLTVVLKDETLEPALDGHGKIKYRTRKHDLEEFQSIINRHGCWKKHIREFAENALKVDKQFSLPLGIKSA